MKNNALVDIAKIIFAFGIVALHTGFLLNTSYGFYVHTIIFRLGVPFFFLTSGYYLAKKNKNNSRENIFEYIKKLSPIYLILSVAYLILNEVRYNSFSPSSILNGIWYIITGRSQSVMWFVGALIISIFIISLLNNKKKLQVGLKAAVILYGIGLLFNTYAFLINNDYFGFLYNFLVGNFGNNSNFLFEGFLFVGIGYYLEKYYKKDNNKTKNIIFLILGIILLVVETIVIKKNLASIVNYEYFLAHLLVVPALFNILVDININIKTNIIRKLSSYIYYFHYAVIIILILINSLYPNHILNNSTYFYLITIICTILYSLVFLKINKKTSEEKNQIKNYITILLYTVSFISLLFSVMTLLNNVVWADEICSLAMIKNTFRNILVINANDVHPPLYYLSLKTFVDYLKLIFTNVNYIFVSKIFSFIPFILLLVLINTRYRKKFGLLTSSIITVLITIMPQIMMNNVEIRMYSWGMALVAFAFTFMADALEKNNKKSWILLTLFSILAVYIHFYACLTMFFIYLAVLIYTFVCNKNLFKKILISGIIVAIAFTPWLIVIVKHLTESGSAFWISPITLSTIVDYVEYVISPSSESIILNVVLMLSVILMSLYAFYKFIKNNNDKNEKFFISLGIFTLTLIVLTGILVSIIFNPLFVSRYMYFAIGIFWISLGIIYGQIIDHNIKFIVLLIIPLLIGIISLNNFIRTEDAKNIIVNDFYKKIENIEDGTIITNEIHVQYLFSYLFPKSNVYIYNQTNPEHMKLMFKNIDGKVDLKNITFEKPVYYLENIYDKDNKEELESKGYILKFKDEFSIDWYSMKIYELEKAE